MAARRPTKRTLASPATGVATRASDDATAPPRQSLAPVPEVAADRADVGPSRDTVDDLAKVVERLRARAVASERESILLSEHLATKSSLLVALRAEAATLRRDLDRALDEHDAARGQHEGTVRELDAVRSALDRQAVDLASARAESSGHQARIHGLSLEATGLRRRLDEAQRERASLATQVDALRADLEASRQLTSSLRDELEAALAELRAAEDAASFATYTDTEAALERAQAEAAATAEALERARAEARDATERLAAVEASRDAYRSHLMTVSTTGPGRVARRWADFSRTHPRAARLIRSPLAGAWRVLTLRWPHWLRQHPLFDRAWYVEVNRDVRDARLRPWWHYIRHGVPEGRAPNRYFDREWYLRTYPDVKVSGMEPLDHYYRFGGWEGRDPSPRFSTSWYLDQHPEVVASGVNALFHFLQLGLQQGFEPRPPTAAMRRAHSWGTVAASAATDPIARPTPPADPRPAPPPAPMAPATSVDVGRVRRAVRDALPESARVGVVSDGHRDLLNLPGVEVVPVPRAADGGPASDIPRNDLSAIAHLESLRVTHVDYLAVPEPSLWLTIVPGLKRHLETRYASVGRDGKGVTILDVRSPLRHAAGDGRDVRSLLRVARERLGRETSVLDWASGTALGADVPGVSVFSPSSDAARRSLPYADVSVDVVVLRDGDAERLAEARRVASSLVIAVADGATGAVANVEWVDGEEPVGTTSVSIVIPTWNDVTLLASCLRTIDETVDGRDVEVIVSDDGSDAAYHEPLEALAARHPRVRLVRNSTNGGYIAAVNAGAATAANDVLVLLNNDTILLPGWLEPLLDTLRDRARTGVVGGMLLYPDGRLQEAGCAIFRDGSATKIGYGDSDPTLAYYAHPRAVDYVSGALLATPRQLFERLGGLDPAFGFGYYEDGDYCFRARREGLDVVYEPRSRVVHVEGGTAGTDVSKGAKRFQATNRALFVDRWGAELERQPVRPEPLDIHASRDLLIRGRGSTAAP